MERTLFPFRLRISWQSDACFQMKRLARAPLQLCSSQRSLPRRAARIEMLEVELRHLYSTSRMIDRGLLAGRR